jgi:diacylglycerol kinase (ATP)
MNERVAVIAHQLKSIDGGLPQLRHELAEAGITDPIWYEVPKSKFAPKRVRQALKDGADLVIAWGGDGLVQRCTTVLAGTDVPLGIIPAGTANVLATNLGIPQDLGEAARIALKGDDRRLDVGRLNGERFAVMAGVGFDARLIDATSKSAKRRFGKLSYLRTGAGAIQAPAMKLRVKVDGETWFKGEATCVLVGNVGQSQGGLVVFPEAMFDDGMLDVGVVTAEGALEWLRVLSRVARRKVAESPFVHESRGRKIDVNLDKKALYEVDGGTRSKVDRLRFTVEPGALNLRVPT